MSFQPKTKPKPLFLSHYPSKAESQRNAEMLERSRATLAEERARCEAVLMQLATFEAEKASMQQEIDGWALPFFACLFFGLYICELPVRCGGIGTCAPVLNCCAGLRSQVAGLEIYAKDMGDKVSSLELIKVESECVFLPAVLRSLPKFIYEQAQHEGTIARLEGVIERLKQSLEELAAAAQVTLLSCAYSHCLA